MNPELEELFAATERQMARTSLAIEELARAASKYIASSDARMLRLEENLDGLIRAITSEHQNGKSRK